MRQIDKGVQRGCGKGAGILEGAMEIPSILLRAA